MGAISYFHLEFVNSILAPFPKMVDGVVLCTLWRPRGCNSKLECATAAVSRTSTMRAFGSQTASRVRAAGATLPCPGRETHNHEPVGLSLIKQDGTSQSDDMTPAGAQE